MATNREKLLRSGIEVVESPYNLTMFWHKKTVGDILAYGDILQEDTNEVELYVSTYDADTFAGICLSDSPGEDDEIDPVIPVLVRGLLRVTVTSSAVTPGEALIVSVGPTAAEKNAGTQVNFVFANGADHGICWAIQDIAASGSGLVYFDLFAQKGIILNASVIETLTSS